LDSKKLVGLFMTVMILTSGCNKFSEQKLGEAVSETEDFYQKSENLDCIAASAGEVVKFRFFLDDDVTKEAAAHLFRKTLQKVQDYAGSSKVWDDYSVQLDVANQERIVFHGVKKAGEKLVISTSDN